MDDLRWLSQRPRIIDAEAFAMIHSSFSRKSRWAYCVDEHTVMENFQDQTYALAFCGHSHQPLIGYDQTPELPMVDFIRDVTLPSDAKIMVNVGSVGQPRDGDNRACACTYVLETRRLELLREPYDVEMAQNKIYMARLPDKFGLRLQVGR